MNLFKSERDLCNIKKNLLNDYYLKDIVGEGSFGIVNLAEHKITNKKVAIKSIFKENLEKRNLTKKFFTEVKLLKACDHPNIVKYIDIYEDDQKFYIVMEYIGKGELFAHVILAKFSEEKSKIVFKQLLDAIEHCHQKSIAHRDIKLENIFVEDDSEINFKIKVGDFGLATLVNESSLHNTFCGSLDYTSPEVIENKKYNPFLVDVWSLGVVLYTMITGAFPWNSKIMNVLTYKCDYDGFSPLVTDLLEKIFTIPEKRISLQEIKKHQWLVK